MTEKELTTLFEYGFITKDEQKVLLQKFKVDGLSSRLKSEILTTLKKNIDQLGKETEKLETEKEKIAKRIKVADIKVRTDIEKEHKRILAEEKEKLWQQKRKKAHEIKAIFDEIERFDREIDDLGKKIMVQLEKKRLNDVRKRLL